MKCFIINLLIVINMDRFCNIPLLFIYSQIISYQIFYSYHASISSDLFFFFLKRKIVKLLI